MSTALAQFDYGSLSTADQELVSAAAERINHRLKNTLADMVEIGRELLAVKERLPHGQFGLWIAAEFGWSHRTAQGFIRVAGAFSKAQNLRICPSAAIRLAAGTTPEPAFAEAIERAQAGEEITHRAAAEIIARHKGDNESTESDSPTMAERLERIDALAFTVPELTAWINEGLAAGFPETWKQPPTAMVQSALKRETDPTNIAALVKASHAAQNFHAEQHLRAGRELGTLVTRAEVAEQAKPDWAKGPSPREAAESDPERRWLASVHKIYVLLNSTRDAGGVASLAAEWNKKGRRACADEARKIIAELERWIETMEPATAAASSKTNGKPGAGIMQANLAINELMRIPKNDPHRKRGFQIVSDWIRSNGGDEPPAAGVGGQA